MNNVSRFVIWICSKFNREQIERIVRELIEILANRNPDIKPKDDFKEKHPNYRNFIVDPEPPETTPVKKSPHFLGKIFSKLINKNTNIL